MCASVGSSCPNYNLCCCKGDCTDRFLFGASLFDLLKWSILDVFLPYLISQIEKCQKKKKKKNKTDHLQLEKDEDKEEAGVQIKPHTARCPQNGPPVPAVSTVMPHEVSAPAHPPFRGRKGQGVTISPPGCCSPQ